MRVITADMNPMFESDVPDCAFDDLFASWRSGSFGRQLFSEKKMDSATFAKAAEFFGKHGAMDLVGVMTTYAASGFYAIAVDEHAAPGKQPL